MKALIPMLVILIAGAATALPGLPARRRQYARRLIANAEDDVEHKRYEPAMRLLCVAAAFDSNRSAQCRRLILRIEQAHWKQVRDQCNAQRREDDSVAAWQDVLVCLRWYWEDRSALDRIRVEIDLMLHGLMDMKPRTAMTADPIDHLVPPFDTAATALQTPWPQRRDGDSAEEFGRRIRRRIDALHEELAMYARALKELSRRPL